MLISISQRDTSDTTNLSAIIMLQRKAPLRRQHLHINLVVRLVEDAVGTAGKMFSTLGANGINIEMISQGASEINISCVIKESDTETGLRAIHRVFVEEA